MTLILCAMFTIALSQLQESQRWPFVATITVVLSVAKLSMS